jgi:hypothetical protein
METNDIKKFIIESLSPDKDSRALKDKLDESGIDYSFSEGFKEKVLDRLARGEVVIHREVDFLRSLSTAFYRIALTGVAAIVILLISIYLMEGSLSFNSFLGLSDNIDEGIVCLLTGN